MPKPKDLTGQKFGRLTAIKSCGSNKLGKRTWLCKCECGSEKIIVSGDLSSGRTRSCGCLVSEFTAKRNYKHGKTNSRLFRIWTNMKNRCHQPNNPDYENYGARGISVCEEWFNDFQSFYDWSINNGYVDTLSIDRIDGNKGYYPDNCRWATAKEQARNIRTNVITSINGKYLTLSEIAEKYKVNYDAVKTRYKKGIRGMNLIKGLKKTGVTIKPESISYSVEV
ncbi:hypothetical protein LCM23_24975 [Cytobacillus kochii]|uniref:hypothetical protein n=1 Tax=Cytobacillus kochii TaxID=859143 RepID=UPI001CD6508B|nr:hypothetical protein [Cytobacillus kochii]MCA1029268.1 hypothetical protein [Cytobacillus kochii]